MTKGKVQLLNILMSEMFHAVTEDDLFEDFNKMSKKEKLELKNGAETLERSIIWNRLSKEMKQVAHKRMYNESKDYDDMMFGKACLYVIDVLERKINNFKNAKV